jgi:ATP-binding cassette subfamily F protein uup
MARPSNVLVLDEPTNDLDVETLDLLQEVLDGYDGTVILVSHDRDFLDRVATVTVAMEGDGTAVPYAGGWSDMMAQRGGRPLGAPAPRAEPRAEPARVARRASPPPRRPGPPRACPSPSATASTRCPPRSTGSAPRSRASRASWPTPASSPASP